MIGLFYLGLFTYMLAAIFAVARVKRFLLSQKFPFILLAIIDAFLFFNIVALGTWATLQLSGKVELFAADYGFAATFALTFYLPLAVAGLLSLLYLSISSAQGFIYALLTSALYVWLTLPNGPLVERYMTNFFMPG